MRLVRAGGEQRAEAGFVVFIAWHPSLARKRISHSDRRLDGARIVDAIDSEMRTFRAERVTAS